MDWLRFTPLAVVELASLVLALLTVSYLASLRQKTQATRVLIVFVGLWSVYVLYYLTTDVVLWDRLYSLSPLHYPFMLFSVAVQLHFAYSFLGNPYPREARFVVPAVYGTAGLLSVHPLYASISGLLTGSTPPPPGLWFPALLSILFLGVLIFSGVIYFRKCIHFDRAADQTRRSWWRVLFRPSVRKARAIRVFAGLPLLPLLVLLTLYGPPPLPAVTQVFTFAQLAVLVFAYLNYAPEPTTVQVKLVGASLVSTLSVLIGLVLLVHGTGADSHDVDLPSHETFRFTPQSDGGYRAVRLDMEFDDEWGERIDPRTQRSVPIALAFAFPFYGSAFETVHVDDDPMVFFEGAPLRYERMPDQFLRDARPKIAPLLVNFCWEWEKTATPGVYVKPEAKRLTVTWAEGTCRPGDRGPRRPTSVQLVLRADGSFDFTYREIGVSMAREAMLGALIGLYPGGEAPRLIQAPIGPAMPLSLSPGTGFLDHLDKRYRDQVHQAMLPFVWAVLAAAFVCLVILPFFIRTSLLKPLTRLLGGVRRVDQGERDVELPIFSRDEIGRLTEHFNHMTDSLCDAECRLLAHAEQLEQRVIERTTELIASNAALEREKISLEESRTQLRAQAEQLLAMDALKTRFFANISHEFRTPLTLLLGPIQDAIRDGGVEGLRSHLPTMERNAQRLLTLIGQLLDLSRLEAGGMHLQARDVDLLPMLRELVPVFTSRAEQKGITLVFDPEVESLRCYVDRDKIEKVVLNLLSNAVKFTDRGGKVRVRLARRRTDTGAWAALTVQDTGRGIPAGELPRIFDRFHRVETDTPRMEEGSGIGLALARELVELHRGTITVESTEQFGSAFAVLLPLGRNHLQPGDIAEGPDPETARIPLVPALLPDGHGLVASARPHSPAIPAENRPTVLIVDDHADLRSYLIGHLTPHYNVVESEDGASGLVTARSRRPDLIICDVMMPLMNGMELCRAVKTDPDLAHIPVVLLTARADEESKLEGLETGADDYLAKPFNADELLLRVENLIELRGKLRSYFGDREVVSPSQVVVSSAETAFVKQVRNVVEAHLADASFGVDLLAAEVGLSTRHLLRRMKDAAGVTPNGYIRMLRLERAAQLLKQRAGSVSEVAYLVGFNQADYFSRLFRQVYGVPPSAYPSDRD